MDLNQTSATKQTLQSAMKNEQHLCLSDSDSTDSDTDRAIKYSSPARFHTSSDSDDSTNSQTHKSTNTNSTTTVNKDSTKVSSPPLESPARSLISSDSDDFTKYESVKASKTNSTTTAVVHTTVNRDSTKVSTPPVEYPARSLIPSDSTTATVTARTTVNGDSTKVYSPPVESPARSSISSDQISLPHECLTLEDNNYKHFAAPTRSPPEIPPEPEIPAVVVKKSMKEEQPLALVKADLFVGDDADSVKEGGDSRRKIRPPLPVLRKAKMDDEMVKKVALGFRIFGFLFCLVSFSVLAADRNKGWALDSFERYMEFRYCMSMNVIGFVYSGAQAFDLAYQSATGKNIVQHHLRYIFDFALDQVVTYLLISASSSAATRIDDWQSNWGKDKFPDMASVSVAMSFLAFAALAFSSLISGYVLCNSR
ncbi:CASP-like protein 4A3 [Lycium ferocissimum]|uniref:CASP-like protein 4A3 n=1 Tax=Lycium ferocissimum TaxID=112874 RepID=UPI00281644E1|nr:CASP-like protein 4A3 [Lycium ferocissimum]